MFEIDVLYDLICFIRLLLVFLNLCTKCKGYGFFCLFYFSTCFYTEDASTPWTCMNSTKIIPVTLFLFIYFIYLLLEAHSSLVCGCIELAEHGPTGFLKIIQFQIQFLSLNLHFQILIKIRCLYFCSQKMSRYSRLGKEKVMWDFILIQTANAIR